VRKGVARGVDLSGTANGARRAKAGEKRKGGKS